MKLKEYSLILVIIILSAAFVQANIEVSETVVYVNADYGQFTNRNQETVSATTSSFTLTNDGNENETVTLSIQNLPGGYRAESKDILVEVNRTSDPVSLTIQIPHAKAPGEVTIGKLSLSTGGSLDVVQRTTSMLNLQKLTFEYTDHKGRAQKETFNTDSGVVSNADDPVQFGTKLKFTFDLKNEFDNRYNSKWSELEDIELEVRADKDLFEEDINDEINFDPLDADERRKEIVTLTVSDDVDDGKYDLTFILRGDDGKGLVHRITKTIKFEIERLRDDVRITSLKVTPDQVLACEGRFFLALAVENLGTRDQKDVDVSVVSSALGINKIYENLRIDDHKSSKRVWREIIPFELDESVAKGLQTLDVTVSLNGKRVDVERISISFVSCDNQVDKETEQEKESDIDVIVLPSEIFTPREPPQSNGLPSVYQKNLLTKRIMGTIALLVFFSVGIVWGILILMRGRK
jgi:hypothetical protein